MAECYIPLIQVFQGWARDGLDARLTLSISPTLCAMLRDPFLQDRYRRFMAERIELAGSEIQRTRWVPECRELAIYYRKRLEAILQTYHDCGGDLVGALAKLQQQNVLEIIITAATHAVLPLFADHPPSIRAQIMIARDEYRRCFGGDPVGFWLPECGYAHEIEPVLQEADILWVVVDTHGLANAQPRPKYGVHRPVITPRGIVVFARDSESARQIWSRQVGYPGDPRYRDFYRDAGFDLELEYVRPYLPGDGSRAATGLKYYAITGPTPHKRFYNPAKALRAVDEHVTHFIQARQRQVRDTSAALGLPPMIVAPFDAELFGHWWFEGTFFLDRLVRRIALQRHTLELITPTDYLRMHPTHQLAVPSPSTWGEGGYLKTWLSGRTAWIYPHLRSAQMRMTALATALDLPNEDQRQVLNRAASELLLAQASDWPFMIHTGRHQIYAIKRLTGHLTKHIQLCNQLVTEVPSNTFVERREAHAAVFPSVNYRYFAAAP